MQRFDIVLVAEYFRSVPYFLSIIKFLSPKYRIAVFRVDIDKRLIDKNESAQTEFFHLCESLGAQVIEDMDVETRLLVIPQRPFLPSAVTSIERRIRARKTVGALAFAWAGIKVHDEFIKQFKIRRVYAIDVKLIQFLLSNRPNPEVYDGLEIAEVGLPYRTYPIFDDFEADYLVAMPTPFSFPHEQDKWIFLESVLNLFDQIPSTATIVHKPHNGFERDQFSS